MSREDDIVNEAAELLSQGPLPEIKPYTVFHGNPMSFEEAKTMRDRYNFIVRQYLGNNFKVVARQGERTSGRLHLTICHKKHFHWFYIKEDNFKDKWFFSSYSCLTPNSEKDFLEAVGTLIAIYRTKELNK